MVNLEVKISFLLYSPYHVSADRLSFGIDKALFLDPQAGMDPAIPASSIKGVLRDSVERILRTKNVSVCEASRRDRMCQCIVCKIFGSPRLKSPLIFSDAILKEAYVDKRIGVGIERRRRTAKEDHLFSVELGYANSFVAKVKGIFNSEHDALEACALLFIGAKVTTTIGANKSRGLGWITCEDFEVFINEKEIAQEEIEKKTRGILK